MTENEMKVVNKAITWVNSLDVDVRSKFMYLLEQCDNKDKKIDIIKELDSLSHEKRIKFILLMHDKIKQLLKHSIIDITP